MRAPLFVALGWYQWDRLGDAATQAGEFIRTVGELRANEFVVLDLEEGTGKNGAR